MIRRDINLGTLVPIGVFLAAQTGALLWWGGVTTQQVRGVELRVLDNSGRLSANEALLRQLSVAVGVSRESAEATDSSLERIEDELLRTNQLLLQLIKERAATPRNDIR